MKLFKIIFSFIFTITVSFGIQAQRAKDGDYTVTTLNDVVNTYTSLTANAAAGATSLTVANNAMSGAHFTGNLAPGDLIMIYQAYGAECNIDVGTVTNGFGPYTVSWGHVWTNNWWQFGHEWGELWGYGNSGKFEQVEVLSVSGGTTINLQCGLKNNYTSAHRVQVIRVPRFDNLTVNNGASIVPTPWNGISGGIVALEVDTDLAMNAGSLISADEFGFRGGQVDLSGSSGSNVAADFTTGNQYRFLGSSNAFEGSEKGESIFGYHTELDAVFSRYGIAGIANGGGGASYENAGGGGGSNIFIGGGTYTGNGTPIGYAAAWNQEFAGFGGSTSPGGGRGGYSQARLNRDALTVGPNNTLWSGDARKINGGRGGHPLAYDATRLFFGGGGGAGDDNSNQGGAGGRGGGIVYITNYGTISGTGTISANGQDGQNANPNNFVIGGAIDRLGIDGAGGGGAGGAIFIQNAASIPATITLRSQGGDGGSQTLRYGDPSLPREADGPGGSGTGGSIAFSSGTPTQLLNAGANGISTVFSGTNLVSEFPPNGATTGNNGFGSLSAPYYDLQISDVTTCTTPVNLTVTVLGTLPVGGTIRWYTQQFGGASFASGTSVSVSPAVTTTYYVGVCPNGGTFRVPVTVTVVSSPNLVITNPSAVCAPSTVDLTAAAVTMGSDVGTLTYWTNAGATIPYGTPSAATNGTYYIRLDIGGGCTIVEPVTATVNPIPNLDITNPTAVCAPSTVNLTAAAVTVGSDAGTLSYWTNPGATIAYGTPATATNGTYYIQLTSGGCSTVEAVTATVNAAPNLVITNPPTACSPSTVDLTEAAVTAGSDAGTLSYWTNAGATIAYGTPATATNGTYYIQLTSGSCSTIEAVTATVTSSPNLTITNPTAVCSPNTVDLTAAAVTAGSDLGTLTYWTNAGATVPYGTPATATNGTYYIRLDLGGGCTAVEAVTATVNASPNLSITNPTAVCNPATVDLTAAAVTTGSDTGTLSYWTNAGATVPYGTPATATNGTYYIQLTSGGCSTVEAVTATVNSGPNLVITNPTAVCNPATVNLTAAAVTAGSDAGTLSYWTNAGATIAYGTPSTATNGTYYIQLTSGGCSTVEAVTATVNPGPNLIITNPTAVCDPLMVDLTAAGVTAGSDAGTLSYWTNAGATIAYGTPSTATNGTYYIQLTSGGCSTVEAVTATVNPMPAVAVANSGPICPGGSFDLNETGGDAVSWTWSTTGGATITTNTDQSPNVTGAVDGDVFNVVITDANSCMNTANTTISVNPAPVLDPIADVVNCGPYTLPTIQGTDLTGSQAYYDNSVLSGGVQITGPITTTQTVWVYDGVATCEDEINFEVTINPLPTVVSFTGGDFYCDGEVVAPILVSVTGTADWTINYTLNGSAQTINSSTNSISLGNAEGVYVLTGISDANCAISANQTQTIVVTTTPATPVASADQTYCVDDAVAEMTVSGTGGTYTWYTDNSLSTLYGSGASINPLGTSQVYYVTESLNGCESAPDDVVITFENCEVTYPTAITPDGDGTNDTWEILGLDEKYPDNIVRIYNRWGNLIFEHKSSVTNPYNNNRWDGTYKGSPLPVSSFYYIIDLNGKSEQATGTVSIILN